MVRKGIVIGHGAVFPEPHNGARVASERLRRMAFQVPPGLRHPIADGQEQVPVAVEGDLCAVMSRGGAPGVRLEDLLDCVETVSLEPGAHQGGGVAIAFGLGVAQIDDAIDLEVRVHRDFLKPALAPDQGVGDAGQRLLEQSAVAHQAQFAGALREQHVAARQKSDAPGMLHAFPPP